MRQCSEELYTFNKENQLKSNDINNENTCKTDRKNKNKVIEFKKIFGKAVEHFSEETIQEALEESKEDNHIALIDLMINKNEINNTNE